MEERLEHRKVGREVLAVRYHDDGFRARTARGVGRQRRRRALQRRAQGRTSRDLEAAAGGVERGTHDLGVGGERIAQHARPREEGQSDSTPRELLAQDLNGLLRDVQAVGRHVLRGHALRYVERDHRVDLRGRAAALDFADLRAGKSRGDAEAGHAHEDDLRDLPRRAR